VTKPMRSIAGHNSSKPSGESIIFASDSEICAELRWTCQNRTNSLHGLKSDFYMRRKN
jgi:hypothetical protein